MSKKIEEIVELYTPNKIATLQLIIVTNFYKNLCIMLSKNASDELKMLIENTEIMNIKNNSNYFENNYNSLHSSNLNDIKMNFDIYFEKNEEIKNLFSFYKFWFVYLKDGNLIDFFSIIENIEGDNIFSTIFNEFRNFYNSLNGRNIEVIEGGQKVMVGGSVLKLLMLSIFILFLISPMAFAPGNESKHESRIGVKLLTAIIKVGQDVNYLTPETSITPYLREYLIENQSTDINFNLFLNGCDNFIQGLIILADFYLGKGNTISETISPSLTDISIGKKIMFLGKIISNSNVKEKSNNLLPQSNSGQIINPDYAVNIQRFTPEQLQDLWYLGQLSDDELTQMPDDVISRLNKIRPLSNAQEAHVIMSKGEWIDGGNKKQKKVKNKTKSKKNKTKKNKTKKNKTKKNKTKKNKTKKNKTKTKQKKRKIKLNN